MCIRSTLIQKLIDFDRYKMGVVSNTDFQSFLSMNTTTLWESVRKLCSPDEYAATLIASSLFSSTKNRLRFYRSVVENPFVAQEAKTKFIHWFTQMQRTYWSFSRLAQKWRWRKPRIQIYTDLYMNTLELSHPHTYPLMQMNNVYLFTLSNLTNIILTAITHADHFCHSPLPIKNPYNNLMFSKSDLYNIYFRIKRVYIKVPVFLQRFFECEFNVYQFKIECETKLREHAIREYVKSAEAIDLYGDIDMMIREVDKNRYLRISPRFPLRLVVQAFRPMLPMYYLSLYSFDKTQRDYCAIRLDRELRRFIYENPKFGQKTGRFVTSHTNPFVETEVVEYYNKWSQPSTVPANVKHYMKNHVFQDTVYEQYMVQGDVDFAYLGLCPPPMTASQLFGHTPPPPSLEESEEEEDEASAQADDEDEEDSVPEQPQISEEIEEDPFSEEDQEEEDYDW